MKRAGFTMIELIFVIVILGILAAVAIPKLAATRDDAKISAIIGNTRTGLGDFKSVYTAQGQAQFFATPFATMTDVPFTKGGCATGQIAGNIIAGTYDVCDSATATGIPCVQFVLVGSATTDDVNLTIKPGTGTSAICTAVRQDPAITAMTGNTAAGLTTQLGGKSVVR